MTKNEDTQHLYLLSIFHYVVGILVGLMSCFPIIHLFVGIGAVTGSLPGYSDMPPTTPDFPLAMMGWFFIIISSIFIVFGLTIAVLIIIAGRKLKKHHSYTYCLVIAGVECIFMPFGTVLGILTIVVLLRDSVKALFNANKNPPSETFPSP